MTVFKIEFSKFLGVGAANFCLTFIAFYVLLNIVGLHYLIALSVAWIVGIIFSYVANYLWVFRPECGLKFGIRFYKFVLSYVVSFLLNMGLLSLLVESHSLDPFLAQIVLVPVVVVFNYSSSKYWSLRRSRIV